MNKTKPEFDIMIVYDAKRACSAADGTYHELTPFAHDAEYFNCNLTYQYFIQYCKQQGLLTAFTTTDDINKDGKFTSVWIYTNRWERRLGTVNAKVIFDKFSRLAPRLKKISCYLSTAKKPLPVFQNLKMQALFDNKLETYLQFPCLTIPTVKMASLTKAGFSAAEKKLHLLCQNHPFHDDFNSVVVLKDQYGMGGSNIFKIKDNSDFAKINFNSAANFVLQPLIQATGFTIAQCSGYTDLRVIICNNKIIQSYLRIAKAGEFRANAIKGGKIIYLNLNQIPAEVIKMIKKIKHLLPSKTALYTLDFIKSNNGHLYFIEGNNNPGIIWFDKEDEKRAKQLIRLIIKNLKKISAFV